jgi:hypothetical protein
MSFRVAVFHVSFFSKEKPSAEPSCIRTQFDEESRWALFLLGSYGIRNIIAAPAIPETSHWMETPDIKHGAPGMWVGGENEEEMLRGILTECAVSRISPQEVLYVDTLSPRIRWMKTMGVATFARANKQNPLAERPLWTIESALDIANIAIAQAPPY